MKRNRTTHKNDYQSFDTLSVRLSYLLFVGKWICIRNIDRNNFTFGMEIPPRVKVCRIALVSLLLYVIKYVHNEPISDLDLFLHF